MITFYVSYFLHLAMLFIYASYILGLKARLSRNLCIETDYYIKIKHNHAKFTINIQNEKYFTLPY